MKLGSQCTRGCRGGGHAAGPLERRGAACCSSGGSEERKGEVGDWGEHCATRQGNRALVFFFKEKDSPTGPGQGGPEQGSCSSAQYALNPREKKKDQCNLVSLTGF